MAQRPGSLKHWSGIILNTSKSSAGEKIEKIKWSNNVINEEVLGRIEEEAPK